MPEISNEQLEEWAQVVYENCGEGENFSNSLYSVVMEMRDASGYYKRPTRAAPDAAYACPCEDTTTKGTRCPTCGMWAAPVS